MEQEESNASDTVEMQEDTNTPLQSAYQLIVEYQHDGKLPLLAMLFVSLYNVIFFKIEPGHGLYYFIPILLLIGAYFSRYWVRVSTGSVILGMLTIFISAAWDLLVSISFFPDPNGGYSLDSVPTLIMDVIAIISLSWWLHVNGVKVVKEAAPEDD